MLGCPSFSLSSRITEERVTPGGKSKGLHNHYFSWKQHNRQTQEKREVPPFRHPHSEDRKERIKIGNWCRKIQLARHCCWNPACLLSEGSCGPRPSLSRKRPKTPWYGSCYLQATRGTRVPAAGAHLRWLGRSPWRPGFDWLNRCAVSYRQTETGEYCPLGKKLSYWRVKHLS